MTDARSADCRRSLPPRRVPCITSSFQAECVVLLHLLREVRPDIPVLFLDTFHHFAQTLRVPRRAGGALEAEPDQPAGGGTAGWPVAAGHEGLLRAAQGRAALLRARGLRRLVHGTAAGPVALARQPARGGAVHAADREESAEGQPARGLDDEGRLAARESARHPAAAALRAWLHEHRLRAVHVTAARSLEPALGPLAGPEARVRDSCAGEDVRVKL